MWTPTVFFCPPLTPNRGSVDSSRITHGDWWFVGTLTAPARLFWVNTMPPPNFGPTYGALLIGCRSTLQARAARRWEQFLNSLYFSDICNIVRYSTQAAPAHPLPASFQGILTAQIYHYYINFHNDPKSTKWLVTFSSFCLTQLLIKPLRLL